MKRPDHGCDHIDDSAPTAAGAPELSALFRVQRPQCTEQELRPSRPGWGWPEPHTPPSPSHTGTVAPSQLLNLTQHPGAPTRPLFPSSLSPFLSSFTKYLLSTRTCKLLFLRLGIQKTNRQNLCPHKGDISAWGQAKKKEVMKTHRACWAPRGLIAVSEGARPAGAGVR